MIVFIFEKRKPREGGQNFCQGSFVGVLRLVGVLKLKDRHCNHLQRDVSNKELDPVGQFVDSGKEMF